MKFLKFIKNYQRMKKVINELEYRNAVAEVNMKKLDESLKGHNNSLAPYKKKRYEFYKGKSEGYKNSILIIEKFIDIGDLPEITEDVEKL